MEKVLPSNLGRTPIYEAEKRKMTIAAVGDILMTRRVSLHQEDAFLALLKIIRGADVAFANVEGTIRDSEGYPCADAAAWVSQEKFAAEEMSWLGIDIVACATNHSMDYSAGGLVATIDYLDKAGIAHAGTGRDLTAARAPAFVDSARGRVALLAMCSFFAPSAVAGEQRHDCAGRPGINSLRTEKRYVVDARALEDLKRISEMLGMEEEKAGKVSFGFGNIPLDTEEIFHFLTTDVDGMYYNKFMRGEHPGIETFVNEHDAAIHFSLIEDAKKQADWVLVSLHTHEADGERETPARFTRPFARACIDAGADAVIGHGPHVLRGIEIYKSKPIFYSLCNFIMQGATVKSHPADFYERYGIDPNITPQKARDAFTRNDTCGFPSLESYFESVCVTFTFDADGLGELKLYPLNLGFGKHRAQQGVPLLADEVLGRKIVERIGKLSAPYGTKIDYKDGVGWVVL